MHPFIQLQRAIPLFVVALTFGLSPIAQAVTPAPDGGYPGENTAEGSSALFSLTTGTHNTATGFEADKASEAILALKPVTFHYKKEIDPSGISQFGLVAEEVEKVNRDLVVRDKEGKAYTVRYEQINAMLLNEFLKEHQAFLKSSVRSNCKKRQSQS